MSFFQPICECNEHKALAQMVDRRSSAFPAIFMADRGYESYNTFAHIEQKGDKYVVRGRESGTGICSGLNLPDTEEYDIEKELYICKKHSKKVKTNPRNINEFAVMQHLIFSQTIVRNID